MEKYFTDLIAIAERKRNIDHGSSWSNGSQTYLAEIVKEVDEVIEEIPKKRLCYLEDELGDILWDYLNIVLALEDERGVDLLSVLKRACGKYDERINGIEAGDHWKNIKERQKKVLAREMEEI